jgi:hypothetical protein
VVETAGEKVTLARLCVGGVSRLSLAALDLLYVLPVPGVFS